MEHLDLLRVLTDQPGILIHDDTALSRRWKRTADGIATRNGWGWWVKLVGWEDTAQGYELRGYFLETSRLNGTLMWDTVLL
eukprot:3601386-Rhodomonas_salina.1